MWSLDARQGGAVRLSSLSLPTNVTITWPGRSEAVLAAAQDLILQATDSNRTTRWYHARLVGGATSRGLTLSTVRRPSETASFTWVSPKTGLALFTDSAPNGTFVWAVADSTGAARRLVSLNEQLAGIKAGGQRLITYRGADGDTLHADLLLPPDYESGKRYPLIVWVYAGEIIQD